MVIGAGKAVCRTVNVVPKLVEHRAAPAAKVCETVVRAYSSSLKRKEKQIGATRPVNATQLERNSLDLNALMFVESPSSYTSKTKPR